ncbi:MAG: molybdopterin-binding protein [Bacillota bacterium]
MEWNLLNKTTFWIEGMELEAVDLGELARVTAGVLGLPDREVVVVDVRPGVVAFDILAGLVKAEKVAGKGRELLERLSEVPGVKLGPGASVHSEGVLGFIAMDPDEAKRAITASEQMADEIRGMISRRALVFASGNEVRDGKIMDTNSPFLIDLLGSAGMVAEFGGVLDDDLESVLNTLEGALSQGYGLIVITGGVGAEDKDWNVEAIKRLDENAYTPWILKFDPDYRRHHKVGVRIAVGRVGATRIVALPGPHNEVVLASRALLEGINQGVDDRSLAARIASVLREHWHEKMRNGGVIDGHSSHIHGASGSRAD